MEPKGEHLLLLSSGPSSAEPEIRIFLLREADILRLTAFRWKEQDESGVLSLRGGSGDPAFAEASGRLAPYHLKTEAVQLAFDDGSVYGGEEHWFYRLEGEVKEVLDRQTLLWGDWDWGELYGFEDPTFYACRSGNEEMVGRVISHESMVYVYAELSDFKGLEARTGGRWSY